MKIANVSFPLYLSNEDIDNQVATISMAFNRYSDTGIKILGYRCCCIALNKNKIVSIGVNKNKTNPNYALYAKLDKMTIHAEIDMIMNISNSDIRKVTDIYVTRGYSQLLPSLPCPICSMYLQKKFKNKTILHYFHEDKWKTIQISEL